MGAKALTEHSKSSTNTQKPPQKMSLRDQKTSYPTPQNGQTGQLYTEASPTPLFQDLTFHLCLCALTDAQKANQQLAALSLSQKWGFVHW